jgi:hypothetical protein
MNIKNTLLPLLTILGLTSCNQSSDNQTSGQVQANSTFDKEIFTLYSRTENAVKVARAMTTSNETFDLHLYELNTSTPEAAQQTTISVQTLTKQELETKSTELKNTYNWTPFKGDNVLFVQIQPRGFKNEIELLDKRQEIEDKLNTVLETNKLGEWFAGDIGPGGGNMLYTVTNIEITLQTILQVLKQNNLDKNVLIGRRIMIDKGDWFYEVIYPTKFTGTFNTM